MRNVHIEEDGTTRIHPDRKVEIEAKPRNNVDMNQDSPEWKHDIIQVVGTAVAIAALILPILMWGIDSKMESVTSKIDGVNSRLDAINQRFDDQYRYIDARTGKK